MAEAERVLLVGAGGHAKVLAEVIESMPGITIAGFVSTDEHDVVYGYPYLGTDDALPALYASGITSALLCIGNNRRRKLVARKLREHSFLLVNAISPAACISKYAHVGTGVAVLPGAVVNSDARLGDAVIVNTNASVDHGCVLGNYVHVGPGATLAGNVTLGEGAFLGAGSTVIPGVSIGAWTVVGAGAVVISDLPAAVLAVGVPAAVSKVITGGES